MYFLKNSKLLFLTGLYLCEALTWRLGPQPLPPIPHKYLYLWNDHRSKGVWW